MVERELGKKHSELLNKLTIDCKQCSGLCCIALYCAKIEGFPADKAAGKPCQNLMEDFRCSIHAKLASANMKGCLAYDCFGAGQKVTQDIFHAANWKTNPNLSNQIFEVFLVVFQLHQMLWYLIEASGIKLGASIQQTIDQLIWENEQMTALNPDEIINIDVEAYRIRVNKILKDVNQMIGVHKKEQKKDFFGKNFKKENLDGRDFTMALMIAANLEGCSLHNTNFLGADLRDANIKNTDLSNSLFLTQMQINAAKGNNNTKLPVSLTKPSTWQ